MCVRQWSKEWSSWRGRQRQQKIMYEGIKERILI
jgi:hypothetical protein